MGNEIFIVKVMMKTVNIDEAKTQLAKLIDEASRGQSFLITKAEKPIAKVTALSVPVGGEVRPLSFSKPRRLSTRSNVIPSDSGGAHTRVKSCIPRWGLHKRVYILSVTPLSCPRGDRKTLDVG